MPLSFIVGKDTPFSNLSTQVARGHSRSSTSSKDIRLLLTIFGVLISAGICIAAIVLTAIHGFTLQSLGVILSFASAAISSLVELFKYNQKPPKKWLNWLASGLALVTTLLFAATAVATFLLSGELGGAILLLMSTSIAACWTATTFNDAEETQAERAIEKKKSQPWLLIITNLLIVGVSLAAQIMAIVFAHQASLAYIFCVSGFNLALTVPILLLSCKEGTFKNNIWPLVAIGAVVSGLFVAATSLVEFQNEIHTLCTLGAICSSFITFGAFWYALALTCRSNTQNFNTAEPSVPHTATQVLQATGPQPGQTAAPTPQAPVAVSSAAGEDKSNIIPDTEQNHRTLGSG